MFLFFQKKRLLNKLPAAPAPDGFNPRNLVKADAPTIPFIFSLSTHTPVDSLVDEQAAKNTVTVIRKNTQTLFML